MKRFLLASVCLAVLPCPSWAVDHPVALSHHPQLFLDDHTIAEMTGLRRRLNQPKKHPAPVLVRKHPWEKRAITVYGTVLYEPQRDRFRMWYLASGDPHAKPEYYICYAESRNGFAWTKPMVGRGAFGPYGDRHNVVIPGGHGICVIETPDDPDPTRRYKAVGGNTLGISPDGITWNIGTPAGKIWSRAVGKNDTGTCVVRWKGEYLAYVRNQGRWPGGVLREVGLCVSKNFRTWTPKRTVFRSDKPDGSPWTQPYGLCVTAYGNVLIGLVPMLRLDKVPRNNALGDMDIQMLVSRDGRSWRRVADRAVFLPQDPVVPRPQRRWDMRVYPATNMLVKDDLVYIYYVGVNMRHGEGKKLKPRPKTDTAIGVATMPADRFVALTPAGAGEGMLRTRACMAVGAELLVNAELTDPGDLKVEVLDGAGAVLPGFERSRCLLQPADKLRYRVRWQPPAGKARSWADVPKGILTSVRFHLRKGELYAFQLLPARHLRP